MKKPNIAFRGLARINLSISSFWNLHKYNIEHCAFKFLEYVAIAAAAFILSFLAGASINAVCNRPADYTGSHLIFSISEGIAGIAVIALFCRLFMKFAIFCDWCDIQYQHAKTFEKRKKYLH